MLQLLKIETIVLTMVNSQNNVGKKTQLFEEICKQERIQSNANHSLAESMGYIKFEGI